MFTWLFIAALFVIAKTTQSFSVSEWLSKLGYIYTMEYYSVIKKNKLWIRATSGINSGELY